MAPMAGITKRATRLSDGRELIYFDDADTTLPPERAPDSRPPAPRPALPALRQDPLTGEWISIAAARQNRAFLPPAELGPLAPSTPGNPTEIPMKFRAGSETGMRAFIGDIQPEAGAARLRAALDGLD